MEEIDIDYNTAESVTVIDNGAESSYGAGSEKYGKILEGWYKMIADAHYMPALGVSINALTLKEKQSGLWVEFDFGKECEYHGMPYEKLLVEVKSDYYGFNLIRYTAEYGYDGRCFYLDLVNRNMSDFYELLSKI